MEAAEIRRRAAEIDWWHTMDLGQGVITQGRDRTLEKLPTIHLPERLDGKTVLDIGAWDGAFSFEAERRGAKRVLAVDPLWDNEDHPGYDKRGFEFAREALNSSVEDAHWNVHELDPGRIGTFDVVLFLGVLYHLRDPIGALRRVAAVTGGLLIVETEGDLLDVRRPAAAFYPADELNHDATNWWGINRPAIRGMLSAVGFQQTTIVYCPPPAQRFVRAVRDRITKGVPITQGRSRGRMVVHAQH